jgi:hypothetical protein
MSRLLYRSFCLALVLGGALTLSAQPAGPVPQPSAVVTNAAIPIAKSPVELFRRLLAMTPEQRERALADRSPENRQGILRKIQQYEKMNAGDRELKLRVTELRWYLPPLLRLPREERAATLATISEPVRKLVQERLLQWDLLPPPLQSEVLDHQSTLGYFAGQNYGPATNSFLVKPPLPPGAQEELTRLRRLTQPQHEEVIASFQKFYDFTAGEKQNFLDALSAEQRAHVEKAMQLLAQLPREQRALSLVAVSKLASMSDAEQQEFMHNAERWRELTPEERQIWRQLASRLPPLPPLPPGSAGTASDQPLITNDSR